MVGRIKRLITRSLKWKDTPMPPRRIRPGQIYRDDEDVELEQIQRTPEPDDEPIADDRLRERFERLIDGRMDGPYRDS